MAITTQDIRKAATDTAYAAAGAADLAAEKLGQVVAEAPGRLEQLRKTDPKELGGRVGKQAKEAQAQVTAKVTGLVGSLDGDLKKLGQTAQDLALQGVGQAVGLAARGGETFEKLAERGREAVRVWRGEQPADVAEIPVATEPSDDAEAAGKEEKEAKAATANQGAKDDAKPAARKSGTKRTAAAKKADDTDAAKSGA
ncbi:MULTISPECIES: hypothetical protein [Streptomyces]|uniref:hypothetical protein n=1 Tax=Streptomyces TaxID=1883 RepID=UPI00163C0014|nr:MULTISPECIES: hypothetical protein [Streptomyces]MBC2875026.1 hypothetical protein [Streptomyces sp. TYQ1024]UBI37462.1 hypothetical protein K7I03_13965 [Streptomyces mobaraensis]UKW30052.1 hypothetical protein MCU78_13930 [Streptomyces sp. TYQ1024]